MSSRPPSTGRSHAPLRDHKGYTGAFTRAQFPGAIANGATVTKIAMDKLGSDSLPLGAKGTVLGSIGNPDIGIAYFIEWHDHPKHAVFTVAHKIAALG